LPETAEPLNFVIRFYFTEPQTWTWVLQMCLSGIMYTKSAL